MKKEISSLILTLCLIQFNSWAQTQFEFKRPLEGINGPGWYQVEVPTELYSTIQEDLDDIRIMAISDGDTTEAPYTIDVTNPIIKILDKNHEIINKSRKRRNYFYTLEMDNLETINEIELELLQRNFSWRVTLEGSNDQKDWFTILNRFRIIGISNSQTDYKYTRLRFPDSKYRYYRISIKSNSRPTLESASSKYYTKIDGNLQNRPVVTQKESQLDAGRFTVIDLKTNSVAPISHIQLSVTDTFDYYRPIEIERLVDSIKYQTGWQKRYETVYSGTLSSFNKDAFSFRHCIVNELRIEITNYDNEPLNILKTEIMGPTHNLRFRVSDDRDYALYYSDKRATGPFYDIEQFLDQIPSDLPTAQLGEEVELPKEGSPEVSALFENKLWLWLIMGAIIIVLALFSINMLKKAQ